MGWKQGEALGLDKTTGLIDPIKVVPKQGKSGLGSK